MLVLTRREQDRIVFPSLGISVEVMKLSRSRVSIGIVAPKGIRVIRHELLEADEMAASDSAGIVSFGSDGHAQKTSGGTAGPSVRTRLLAAREAVIGGRNEDAQRVIDRLLEELDRSGQSESVGHAMDRSIASSSDSRRKGSVTRVREERTKYQVSRAVPESAAPRRFDSQLPVGLNPHSGSALRPPVDRLVTDERLDAEHCLPEHCLPEHCLSRNCGRGADTVAQTRGLFEMSAA